jgi:branched-subunit amino acid aminotransferase/4-amino-4-deoxychorismate lyase
MSKSNKLKVYLNGKIIPAAEATISVSDPAFLHGASVFTTMLAHNGVVFHFQQHLERLAETVRVIGLNTTTTTGELIEGMYEVLEANALTEARCRITLTPGAPDGDPVTLISAAPLPEYPVEWYTKGIKVIVTALKQIPGDPMFGYKTGCYLPRILARQEAAAKGAEDALWYTGDNQKHLAESCFSNVFLVLDGTVFTPPRDTPVLPGVVREAVIELCKKLEIPVKDDVPLTVKEMLAATECFLTSSCMGIRPVATIERHDVAKDDNPTPGPITKKLMQAYNKLLDEECENK